MRAADRDETQLEPMANPWEKPAEKKLLDQLMAKIARGELTHEQARAYFDHETQR